MFDDIPRWPIFLGVLIISAAVGYLQMSPPSIGAGSSTDEVCRVVEKMADGSYPQGDGLLTKFLGVSSDCAASIMTLNFSVAARGSEAAGVWTSLNSQLRQAFCNGSVFRALVGRGWTIKAFYRFSDQSTRTINIRSCPVGTA